MSYMGRGPLLSVQEWHFLHSSHPAQQVICNYLEQQFPKCRLFSLPSQGHLKFVWLYKTGGIKRESVVLLWEHAARRSSSNNSCLLSLGWRGLSEYVLLIAVSTTKFPCSVYSVCYYVVACGWPLQKCLNKSPISLVKFIEYA